MRLLLLLFLTLNLLNAQKLALLIGNSQYTNLHKLTSPSKDIPALAKKLRGMEFEVTELYDLDEKAMKKAIKDFKKRLQKYPDAIALFYYSGHGSQADGESYLIPIDGDTRDEADVEADGVKVETIAMKMANARTKANILFLDACRDVPTGTMGNGTKGLGQVKNRPSGSLIVYSTSKNTTAKDDRLFNKVVLEKLATNVPLTTLANDISYSVDQKTNGKQVPEVFAKSLPTLCLSGSCNQQQEVKVVEKIVYRDRITSPNRMIVTTTQYTDNKKEVGIQVAAASSFEKAEYCAEPYKLKGYKLMIKKFGTNYKVILIGFKSRAEAKKFISSTNNRGFIVNLK